jgi:hypothetical protein
MDIVGSKLPCSHSDWIATLNQGTLVKTVNPGTQEVEFDSVHTCVNCGRETDYKGYKEVMRIRTMTWYEREDLPL